MSDHSAKILVVEDEPSMREILCMLLEGEGHTVTASQDGTAGMDLLDRDIFDLVITDIKMPGATGFEVLKKAQEVAPDTLVIMITAFGTLESGVEAMKLGAYDYIHKPFKIDEIRLIVRNALDRRRLKEEVALLRQTVKATVEVDRIVGKSEAMQAVLRQLSKIAESMANVLITGESGTGKELIAVALHTLSPRAAANFVAINCASVPEGLLESELFGHMRGSFTGAVQNKQGLFELAHGGTLFLDEIGEMPVALQSKLLRAIEGGTFRRVGGTQDVVVDVRIVSATNKDIKRSIEEGSFREDLFFRLNVIPVRIPPLRERREDIPALLEHFIKKFSGGRTRQFTGSAMSLLMRYAWPGNVRELENMAERMLLLTENDMVSEQDLPQDIRAAVAEAERPKETPPPAAPSPQPTNSASEHPILTGGVDLEALLGDVERKYLIEAMRLTMGNRTEAAKLLNLTIRSFRHKLSKYGIRHVSEEGSSDIMEL